MQGHWSGSNELWLRPDTEAFRSTATAHITGEQVRYHCAKGDQAHDGVLLLHDEGIRWKESFHQPMETELKPDDANGALVSAVYTYTADPDPLWRWRIIVSQRPGGTLVVQMTNITPWGEEAPAVRMVLDPTPADELP